MPVRKDYFCHLLNTRVVPRLLRFSLMASILVVVSTAANAQTVPSWVGNLLFMADPTLTAPEAQGLGLKFELLVGHGGFGTGCLTGFGTLST